MLNVNVGSSSSSSVSSEEVPLVRGNRMKSNWLWSWEINMSWLYWETQMEHEGHFKRISRELTGRGTVKSLDVTVPRSLWSGSNDPILEANRRSVLEQWHRCVQTSIHPSSLDEPANLSPCMKLYNDDTGKHASWRCQPKSPLKRTTTTWYRHYIFLCWSVLKKTFVYWYKQFFECTFLTEWRHPCIEEVPNWSHSLKKEC